MLRHLAICLGFFALQASAESPQELERLVDRVALYPDPLLSNVLVAAGYPDQIFEAARWANEHSYLREDTLASAIADDRLWFDPSVQALLPFPGVLDMMARNVGWTQQLGDAFLNDRGAVMDTIQRLRRRAWEFGYLRSTPEIAVRTGSYIEIVPVRPGYFAVPVYDPAVVYYRPRPGFRVAGAISFGPGITLGAAFAPLGWGVGFNRFAWDTHAVIINNRPWVRTRENRAIYAHPYQVQRYERREDRREIHERRDDRPEDNGKGRGRDQDRSPGR
jgi:hypothetical protein